MSSMDSGSILLNRYLGFGLHLFRFFQGFVDRSDHVKGLLRHVVVFAFHDFLEAADRIFNLYVLAFKTRELRRNEHGLRQESFDLTRAGYGALVFIGKLFNAQNRDDVLQIFVTLQNGFDTARHSVVFSADNPRIENTGVAGQRINRGINAALHDLPAEVRRGVQVREGRGRSWIGVVVRWNIDSLHRSNRARLGRSDALLE